MMCATYTRKLAQKKANALLQKMPSAVVIVDDDLRIIECNSNFVRLFASEEERRSKISRAAPSVTSCPSLTSSAACSIPAKTSSATTSATSAASSPPASSPSSPSVLCGIFRDISEPIFQKEQIIDRAREVIQKNLKTVQQIAYLLGENAADSEIILNSIVRSFSPEEIDDATTGSTVTTTESFIEVDSYQRAKHGQMISGDVFLSQKVRTKAASSPSSPTASAAASRPASSPA
jgi:hypothetical protein